MDSDSARHILQRRGPGGLKHIEIRCLSIQQLIREKRLSVSRVDTKNNTADLFTKHLDGLRTRALAKKLGLRFLDMADGGTNVDMADGGTNEVSSFSFNMWQIVHYIDIDICTLTQSLPCCCLPCCLSFFLFSLSTDRHSSVVQYSSWFPCTHMDRTGLEFILSLRKKNSSHCHLDIIPKNLLLFFF